MIKKSAHLSKKIFSSDIEQVPTRNGYGEGLVEAGKKDKRVVALCADLTESTRTEYFKKVFPERFIEVGVAEQLLATLAAGMANYGKIPFIASYSAFSPGRNWEQIRTTIALNDLPVKIAGAHSGISVGPDGATHQQLEDIAIMRAMPNMMVIAPCDSIETTKATISAAQTAKPIYIRFTREKTPVFTTNKTPFKIGKAEIFWESKNPKVTIIGCGSLVYEALLAARELKSQGIGSIVINSHTIKPLDKNTIINAVKKTKAVVTIEEHQITGGLGGAVAEILSQNYPTPIRFVGIKDRFGESGEPQELLKKFGCTAQDVIKAVKDMIRKK
ncbi:transketolase family protein [Candidatus Pacearchaeota archaeon]|nr:transketolase family protein [Candidatus Pacearchaeota archaeon]